MPNHDSPRRAVFPGTFDPVTFGHLDLITRASLVFDHLTVIVAAHHDKRHVFTPEERVELLENATRGQDHVDIIAFDGLLVDCARDLSATAIVRGIRSAADLEYERQLALTNRALAPDIDTVLLLSAQEHGHVSSTLVRQIARLGGDLTPFVPKGVEAALQAKLQDSQDNQ